MQQLLVAVDFSTHADNAAQYALKLAGVLKSRVSLCNSHLSATVTSERPQNMRSGPSPVDPRFDCFEQEDKSSLDYVECLCEIGPLPTVVNSMVKNKGIGLLVMGMSKGNQGSSYRLGSHSQQMLQETVCPLLLIPAGYMLGGISKIVFATDLHADDVPMLDALVGLARHFNADIDVLEVQHPEQRADAVRIHEFLQEVQQHNSYPHIYYRYMTRAEFTTGFTGGGDLEMMDILAMGRRFHTSLPDSFTAGQARRTEVPLMIFPDQGNAVVLSRPYMESLSAH